MRLTKVSIERVFTKISKLTKIQGCIKPPFSPPPGGGVKKMIFGGDWRKKMIFGVLVRAVFLKKYALFG